MIQNVDFLVRLIAIGAGLMLMGQIVAGAIREKIKLPLVATIIGALAFLIASSDLMGPTGPLSAWIGLVAATTPLSIWLMGRGMASREPARHLILVAAVALLLGWFLTYFLPAVEPAGFIALHSAALTLLADTGRIAWERRKVGPVSIDISLPLVAAGAGTLLVLLALADWFVDMREPQSAIRMVEAIVIVVTLLFAGQALTRVDDEFPIDDEAEADEVEPAEIQQID